jgi:AraC-like DNA-binding protein
MQKTPCVVPPVSILSLPDSSPDTSRVWVSHFSGKHNTQVSRPHAHSFFELLFVEDGEGWYRMGERQVWAKPGDLFVIAPGEVHDPSGLDGASKWIIAFKADALAPEKTDADVFLLRPNELLLLSFLRSEDVETRHLWVAPEERLRWLLQLKQLESELGDKRLGFTEAARALLMLLLIDTRRLAGSQLKNCSVQPRPLLKNVFRFIEANYQHAIGLKEVAKAVSLSPAYLTDLVRRETGRTVNQWIVERRIAQARCLLLETDQSVNQIAQTVGYLDPGHFIRLFRRLNGTTPQVWRQNYFS